MPRPICFMVTPFGKKPTGGGENTPVEVDFDALWNQALWPLLDGLGYEPVRADQDLGASIITEMIERLALSDLVLADLTLPNANVYYEVGVRHAAREKGCVLIAAEWSKQPFDTSQMRQLRYPLPDGRKPDREAIKESLEKGIQAMRDSLTPCHALAGFPNLSVARTTAFANFLRELSAFQSRVRRIYLEPVPADRKKRVAETVAAAPVGAMSASMAQELIVLIRDCGEGFAGVGEFIAKLPQALRDHPAIEEQRLLACAEAGDPLEAIAGLEELIHRRGGTPERLGLLGGRYKRLFRSSKKPSELDKAIDAYRRGAMLDLNAYYCSSNLPLLLRTRGRSEDVAEAARWSTQVGLACARSRGSGLGDEWLLPTLLGSAFDAADAPLAEQLLVEIQGADAKALIAWKLKSTIGNLKGSVDLIPDAALKERLARSVSALEVLAGQP